VPFTITYPEYRSLLTRGTWDYFGNTVCLPRYACCPPHCKPPDGPVPLRIFVECCHIEPPGAPARIHTIFVIGWESSAQAWLLFLLLAISFDPIQGI
jgi:hypothetical protein